MQRKAIARGRTNDRVVGAAAAALLGLAHLSVCRADPKVKAEDSTPAEEQAGSEAQEWFAKGRAAYERGDHAAALVAFRAAYDLWPAPAILFNIAQSLRLSEHCDEALEHYALVRQSGMTLPADFESLEAQAKECSVKQHASAARATPDASPTEAPAPTPTAGSEQAAGISQPVALASPVPAPTRLAADAPTPSAAGEGVSWAKLGGSLCLGASVGSAVVGGLFVSRAAAAPQQTADGQSDEDARQNAADWAIGWFATSALTAGVGLWFLLSAPEAEPVRVGLSPTPQGLSTTVQGRF